MNQVMSNTSAQLASLVGGLGLIIALIFALSWFVKRFSRGGFFQNPSMKVVASLPLGTRERLMLVDVGGKQILLGVTAAQINTLHVFDSPVVSDAKTPPANSEFSQKLMAILQQKTFIQPDNSSSNNTKGV
jgi:flagellar protein FliO/FliZ